ncbi:MAG: hypothetical protein PWQ56_424 [Patescibacteria group bacterium]|nr:hypothetical protein [Patescibacteria group bacterium]
MQEKKFQKKIESFVCQKCGNKVNGQGYTDHCPECLWSKHVDINPGDRKSECFGLMEPIGAKVKKDKYIIYYSCTKCGYNHRVKSAPDDNFEKIVQIINKPLKE